MPELPEPKYKPRIDVPPVQDQSVAEAGMYAEIQVTSNFSFLRGGSHPEELISKAKELGYAAIAITDRHTLAGVVRAHVAAKETGISLMVGCRVDIGAWELSHHGDTEARRIDETDSPITNYQLPMTSLLLFPTNRASYGRLCRMLTLGKRRSEKGLCHLTFEDLREYQAGMLGVVVEGHRSAESLGRLRELFDEDRLSLAISRAASPEEEERFGRIVELSQEFDVPLVATNDVHYHVAERQPLQDVLTCIRLGATIHDVGQVLFANAERHLKPIAEMQRLFAEYPKAMERTLELARRATAFSLNQLKYEYPHEVCPPGKTLMGYLKELTWAGARERYGGKAVRQSGSKAVRDEREPPIASLPHCLTASEDNLLGTISGITLSDSETACLCGDPVPCGHECVPTEIRKRLEHEFALIEELNYPAYFLTVYDIVRFARGRGILCQGRGAAANSAVCYCLGITAVDPSRIDLLVERFMSRERNEPPDIDIDFEHERREEVIQYIYERFGRERAGLTAEVISYRRRSAIREVGKAMGLSLDCVDRLAKSHDWWSKSVINDGELTSLGLDPRDATIRKVVALAHELLGFPRHLSQHVGGFVITEGPLCEMVPIENAAMPDRTVIEWDKDDIDAMGMLKIDVLGLGMLTAIRKAIDLVNGFHGPLQHGDAEARSFTNYPIQFHTVPPEDPAVYDMLCNGDSVGVFQVESRAQMAMLPRLKPKCYYDLVIEVAIVRPGPIQGGMVHPYLRRRNNEEEITYPNDAIKQVLGRTLGVPLFQEQAMRLSMVAAGFSGGEADALRRAMAAWKRKGHLLLAFGEKMIAGMLANGYTKAFAYRVFEQIKGFGEYGFPESHAASFALLVYVSAWLKLRHPAAFCAGLINSQPMGFYQPAQLIRDAQQHGVTARAVDVNHSQWDCTLEGETKAVRQSGSEAVRGEEKKPITALLPHCLTASPTSPVLRLGFRLIKGLKEAEARKISEAVARAGPFTSIAGLWRASGVSVRTLRLLAGADAFGSMGLDRQRALWAISKLRDEHLPIFDGTAEPGEVAARLPRVRMERTVMHDYNATGFSLKAHPLSFVRPRLMAMGVFDNGMLADERKTPHNWPIQVAGLVLVRQRPGTASGIIFVTLEDETGVANLVVQPHIYEAFRRAIRSSVGLIARGHVERQGKVVHVIVREAMDLRDLREMASHSRDFH